MEEKKYGKKWSGKGKTTVNRESRTVNRKWSTTCCHRYTLKVERIAVSDMDNALYGTKIRNILHR